MAKYGVTLGQDLVVEPSPIGRLLGVGPEVPLVMQYEQHAITKDMAKVMTGFPLTRSVSPAKTPPKGVTVTPLARTSAEAWGETNLAGLKRGEPASRDDKDTPGPVPVLVAVTIEPTAAPKAGQGTDEAKKPSGRLVVLGTSTLASNQALGFQGNRDLFLNVVAWLAGQEDEIAVRPKDPRQNPIVATEAQKNAILWLSMVVLPGAVMICGIALVVRRRRSK
jgi:ABC-type uncharacterized transport system involved in gliding motility auxiliary subunit